MQKIKEGDFVNYKFRDNHLTNGTIVEIIKIPEGERQLINQENNMIINVSNCYYQLLRLDTDESVSIYKDEFYRNFSTIEIETHHFKGLEAKWDHYDYPFKKRKTENNISSEIQYIKFVYIIIEDLKIIRFFHFIDINYNKQVDISGYYLLENININKQDSFNYFFEEKNGEFNIKDNLETITEINQLFDKLDSINYHYNKKEIVNLKQDGNQQSN